jgi:hypothetical protein
MGMQVGRACDYSGGFCQSLGEKRKRHVIMYLARKSINGRTRYLIRESLRPTGAAFFVSRDLFDLGEDPAGFISYYGRYGFQVDPIIEETLYAQGVDVSVAELEDIFWPFIKTGVKSNLEAINYLRQSYRRPQKLSREEAARISNEIHIFDKRRLHYLRTGSPDQSRISRVPLKMFRVLLDKSRDEIEQYFLRMESALNAAELKQYVYAIFDLQRFFTEAKARILPQILDQDKLDDCFLQEICALNADKNYWTGMEMTDWLHEYLVRYAVLFFDFDFPRRSFASEYGREFMGRHRGFRFPEKRSRVALEEASRVFGVTREKLQMMSRTELTRLYRRKALKMHPDKGGEHELFVKLTKTYRELLKIKIKK